MAGNFLDPLASADWNRDTAKHLLNRAGFGVPHALVDWLTALGPEEAVDCLVDYERQADTLPAPDFVIAPLSPEETRRLVAPLSEDQLRQASNAANEWERQNIDLLRAWWIERMLRTPRPLEEKLTLFWHGHFAVSASKVEESWKHYHLNDTLRKNAAGNLRSLTLKVARSPAMLRYLDNDQNRKGQPNENWARELLELFTMGHGHYTEKDIKEAARAFTGWTADYKGFVYEEGWHDAGAKTFLGQTGNFDGWDIIRIIFEQPETAEFLVRKLWAFFAYEDPEPEIIVGLAKLLREGDYELRPVLRALFRAKAFHSERALGTQIKSPVQLAVQLCGDFNIDPVPHIELAAGLDSLGQVLFYPPNVAGWEGGRAWINSDALLTRYNFPVALATATFPGETALDQAMMMGGMAQEERFFDPAMDPSGVMTRLVTAFPEGHARRTLVSRLKLDDPNHRRFLRDWVEAWRARPGWSGRKLIEELRFAAAAECVRALEDRFLARTLSEDRRAILYRALGAANGETPLSPAALEDAQINSVLHLLTSAAEYQLC